MNKEQLFSLYKEQQEVTVPHMKSLCDEYPELLDSSVNEPEFLASHISMHSKSQADEISLHGSSVKHTVSFCSNLSRLKKGKVLFEDILTKRKEHKIFLEMEPEDDHDERMWYYIDDKDSKIIGPLTPIDMNSRFELDILKTTTMIKKKYDEEYFNLSVFAKRYLKNHLTEKLDIQKEHAALSNKITQFKKGEAFTKFGKQKEIFEPTSRDERFFSQAVRPIFAEFNGLKISELENEEKEESRARRNTEQP
jgi:hypothetical protein